MKKQIVLERLLIISMVLLLITVTVMIAFTLGKHQAAQEYQVALNAMEDSTIVEGKAEQVVPSWTESDEEPSWPEAANATDYVTTTVEDDATPEPTWAGGDIVEVKDEAEAEQLFPEEDSPSWRTE